MTTMEKLFYGFLAIIVNVTILPTSVQFYYYRCFNYCFFLSLPPTLLVPACPVPCLAVCLLLRALHL